MKSPVVGGLDERKIVRGMGKFIMPQQYFYLVKNVKYYLDIENERVDKRINKLEDDLEKLKNVYLMFLKPQDNSCLLAIEFAANVVAKGTIMKYSASDENIEVMMETIFQGEALIPIPLEEEFIVKVKDALGHILANTLRKSGGETCDTSKETCNTSEETRNTTKGRCNTFKRINRK
uniref:Uncharacterized protein n=1 Tax=Lactuca sativa TaxID=4236 RepID=A0A9R1VK60_LACSA|nr:hypothetical protein LSAT_V11C500258140 [Lactuca sativa]